MRISCCYGCVPPDRSPYCHATCQKYLKEKKESEAAKAEQLKRTFGSESAKQTIISGCIKWRKIRRHLK